MSSNEQATEVDNLFVQSLAKGLKVLEAFSSLQDSISLTELVAATGMTKSGVQRLTHTLEQTGYIRKDALSKRYSLTPRVLELGYFFLRTNPLVAKVTPTLVAARERLGLAMHVSVLEDDDLLYLFRLPSRELKVVEMLPGRRTSAFSTSSGRVLLSAYPDDKVRDILKRKPVPAMTPQTVTDPDELMALVAECRSQGYSISQDQLITGQIGVAGPIFNAARKMVAAVNIVARTSDWPLARVEAELLPQLLALVQELSTY
ncbi:IclR family transcriptional regulator [Paraburkholderia unamae]|uniref:IclR family transcriptional regulator n=1 Tax=Paraburkholderia unamae TaxID=219649 RepID=UPI0014026F50|nr:IclR family transcriptional regulator C-terminal domain-containing protein [Paraburkholderia unamae]